MRSNIRSLILLVVILLIIALALPLESAPSADLINGDLNKSVLYDGGYIPHLELLGNTLVVSAIDTITVYDISQAPAQQVQTRFASDNRVTSLDPTGQWLAFNLPGVDGDGLRVSFLEELTQANPQLGYSEVHETQRVNDLVLDASLITYAATGEGTVWFAQDTGNLAKVQAHTGGAKTVSLSSTGQLASGGADGTVKLWTGQSTSETITFGQSVEQVNWSPVASNQMAVRLADGAVNMWQDGTIQVFPASATTLAWSPDGSQLALGQPSGAIQIWDVASQTQITSLAGHSMQVTALAWGDVALVSAALDGQVHIWNSQWEVRETLDVFLCCLRNLTGNGTLFLFQQTAVIWEWNNANQQLRPVLVDELRAVEMALSPSGNYLAIEGFITISEPYLTLYERTPEGNYQHVATDSSTVTGGNWIIDMQFTPNEDRLIGTYTTSDGGSLGEWNVPNLQLISETPFSGRPDGLTFASDGSVAFVRNDNYLTIKQGADLQTSVYDFPGTFDMSYSPNGQMIAIGSNGFAALVDLASPEFATNGCFTQASLNFETTYPTYLDFAASGSILVCANTELTLYDPLQYGIISSYPLDDSGHPTSNANGLELSSDENQVFVLYGNEFQVWQSGSISPTPTPTDTPTAMPTNTTTPTGTPTATSTNTPTPTLTPTPAGACTFDIADGDSIMLINAIESANNTPEPDTICLAEGGTYTFTSAYASSTCGGQKVRQRMFRRSGGPSIIMRESRSPQK